jgi:monofunctional biosynthetic peptidoglycan transglycosylase
MFQTLFPWSDHHARQGRKKKTGGRARFFLKKAAWLAFAVILLDILMIGVLRWVPVPFSAFMLQRMLEGQAIDYRWVAWERVSPHVAMAVIAAEDQKFPQHWGFDFDAIAQALEENRSRSAPRGASTISQQVAKNLFFWSGRSWLRKGLEAYQTVWIELLWPKQRILEVYLNIAELGPGIFGVAAASRAYFQKPPSGLTPYQSALLAAVLPNPHEFKVQRPSFYVRERVAHIRRQVALLGGVHYLSALDR